MLTDTALGLGEAWQIGLLGHLWIVVFRTRTALGDSLDGVQG